MRGRSSFPLFAVLFLAGGSGCQSDKASHQEGSRADSAPASAEHASSKATPSPPRNTAAARRGIPCRAIAVDGEVRSEGDAGLAIASEVGLGADGWLTLGPGARLVAKDPRTTRETTFRGPARVRACVGGIEESWIASGMSESNVGAGEAPGAEEWVVTPLGVVRFAAAKLAVQEFSHRHVKTASPSAKPADTSAPAQKPVVTMREGVRVALSEGVAFVWPASDAGERGPDGGVAGGNADDGWIRISDGVVVLSPNVARTPLEGARAALDSCTAIGKSARDLATALLEGDSGMAQVAARQVTTRRLARAACAVAALRVQAIPETEDPAAKATVATSLDDALTLWQELPTAP